MFSELDETIRQVLINEAGFDTGQIDVSFDLPNREWSAGISRPTINCYLFDIRENANLMQTGLSKPKAGSNGSMASMRPPLRMDLTYLITAWTREVEDEHRLLWRAFRTLFQIPVLPARYLQGVLREHTLPIYTSIAKPDGVLKSPGDFWTALENHLKPSLSYVVTLAVERDAMPIGEPVLTQELRVMRTTPEDEAAGRGLATGQHTLVATTYVVRGVVRDRTGASVAGALVTVLGSAAEGFVTGADGVFVLRSLPAGPLTLVVGRPGSQAQHRATTIPSPSYDLVLD